MKTILHWMSNLLMIGCLVWSCQSAPSGNLEEAPSRPEEAPPDVGGLQMPRGLISKTEAVTPGYVMFTPLNSDNTFLINLDGEVVHTWKSEYGPSGWLYLKDNGNLVRGGRDPEAPVFGAGGQGGILQEFSWDGELLWEYKFANEEHQTHHDVAIMPNGNILAIAWEGKTAEAAVQAGRNTDRIPKAGVWPDMIVELEPVGKDDAKIVWEWHLWDHLVQNHDETKDNYGDPAEHPELIDINLGRPLPPPPSQEEIDQQRATNNAVTNSTPDNRGSDLFHTNAINYNADLDQIVISSPSKGEIYIIDHSTTTEEASGHEGGRWGRGGDILYRWGNPQNYLRGDSTHQALGGQHDIQWIPPGLPGAGNLLVFNNNVPGGNPPHSTILEWEPPLTESGYAQAADGRFGPATPKWFYMAKDTASFFSPFISGVQRLANGHTFITEGPRGRYFEVTPAGEIVWEYWTPYSGDVRMPDGTSPQPVGPFKFATFRAIKIEQNHPALAGKQLTAIDPVPPVDAEVMKE